MAPACPPHLSLYSQVLYHTEPLPVARPPARLPSRPSPNPHHLLPTYVPEVLPRDGLRSSAVTVYIELACQSLTAPSQSSRTSSLVHWKASACRRQETPSKTRCVGARESGARTRILTSTDAAPNDIEEMLPGWGETRECKVVTRTVADHDVASSANAMTLSR